jgi:hypothetical protein
VIPRAALILALLGAVPGDARAQHDAGPALAHIRSGALIRIDLAGRERLEGHLGSVTADSLLLTGPGGERWVALAQIEALYERVATTRAAAKIGAVTGGLVGGAVLGYACFAESSPDEGGKGSEWMGCAAVGGILGAGGGAAIGAGIGSLIPKWHLRFGSRREVVPLN